MQFWPAKTSAGGGEEEIGSRKNLIFGFGAIYDVTFYDTLNL
jgi:hypothetical protein